MWRTKENFVNIHSTHLKDYFTQEIDEVKCQTQFKHEFSDLGVPVSVT